MAAAMPCTASPAANPWLSVSKTAWATPPIRNQRTHHAVDGNRCLDVACSVTGLSEYVLLENP